jgi:DNA-binding transcriptional regulator GbsR (MarR family)
MGQRVFTDLQLEQLFREGNGVSQIARILGVSKGTVSKRLKKLNIGIAHNISLYHAGEIVKKEINAAEQLLKINDTANTLLDRLMKVIEGDQEELKKIAPLLGGKSGPIEAAVKIKAEIRQQLRLQLEIFQALYDMQAVAEFQKEVLEAIGNAEPEVRDRIIQNLTKARALRSTFDLH